MGISWVFHGHFSMLFVLESFIGISWVFHGHFSVLFVLESFTGFSCYTEFKAF